MTWLRPDSGPRINTQSPHNHPIVCSNHQQPPPIQHPIHQHHHINTITINNTIKHQHQQCTGSATKVFVNGAWVGVHREPQQLAATLRALRRQLDINTEVGLVHDYGLQVGAVG